MIIDLNDFLKDKPNIHVSSIFSSYNNSLKFTHENVDEFLFNIEIGKFIIELVRENNYYHFFIWNKTEDLSIQNMENVDVSNIKDELIKAITYCEKYNNLQVFS